MLFVCFVFTWGEVNGQVTVQIGNATSTGYFFPIYSCYGFNYSQQIFLASEITNGGGVSGQPITKIRFYYNLGGTNYANWTSWTVYLGNTGKSEFSGTTDWVPTSSMTQVFSGDIPTPVVGTWLEITLSTPFTYTGSNLVIAIDENTANYSCTAAWRSFASGSNRGILYYSDGTNPDPDSPPTANIGPTATIAQLQMVMGNPTSCQNPTALNATNVTSNSATVNWTASPSNPSSGYQIYYNTSGIAPAVGTPPSGTVGAGVTTYNMSSLSAETTYYVWVRANCGAGNLSSWAGYTSFHTGYCVPSGATNYYLTNVFTTGGVTNISNATGASAGGYGDYNATISCSNFIGANTTITLTPSSGTNYFYCWIDWNNNLDFGDANETVFATTTYTSNYTGTIAIPSGTANGNYRMRVANSFSGAITSCGPASNGEYEDYTFKVVSTPPCYQLPTALTSSAVTSSTATISWTAASPAPASGYDYYYSTSSTAPTSGTTPSGSVGAGVTSANLTGLTANTTYYFWVRSNCNGTDKSGWVGTTFYTGYCIPSGSSVDGTGITNVTFGLSPNIVNNTTAAEINNYGNYSALIGNLQASVASTVSITFNTSTYNYNTKIWIDVNNDLDFVDAGEEVYLGTSGTTSPNTLVATFAIPGTTSLGNHRMRIGAGDYGAPLPCATGVTYTCFEDYTINVLAAPPCADMPSALTSSNVTTSSATISWTAAYPAPGNGYEYYYSTNSTAPTSGTTPSGSVGAGVTLANLTGLTANTTYYFWVRSNCNGTDKSGWAGTSFYTGYCIPSGSSVDATGITNVTFGLSPNIVNNTTVAETNNYGNYSAQIGDLQLITTSTVSITFNTLTYNYNTKIWIDLNNDLDFVDAGEEVYLGLSATTSPNTLVATFAIPGTTSLGNHRMRIGAGDFSAPSPCATGVSYTCFEDYTINVKAAPPCPGIPSALILSSVNASSATISWTAASPAPGNGYEYYYSTSATAPTSGTTPSGSVGAGVTSVNLTGLTAGTTYYFWVRSNCNGTDKSGWVGYLLFTTGYCTPHGATNHYLQKVVTTGGVTNISNTTGASIGGYADYHTTKSCSNFIGANTYITLTPNAGDNFFYCWIDWNNDADFSDANETVFATNGYTPNYTGTIVIPSGTAIGDYRMRVANSFTGVVTSCGPSSYGEYEDYTFKCINPCPAINIPSAPVTNQDLVCGSNTLNSGTVPATCGDAPDAYKDGNEALYTFTPTVSADYTISYSGLDYSAIFVYSGSCPLTGTCVGSIGDDLTDKELTVTLTAGITYFIWFDTWPAPDSPCPGKFSISFPPPCIAATTMACETQYTATLIPGNSYFNNYPGIATSYSGSEKVWIFKAPATGNYAFYLNQGVENADFMLMSACDDNNCTNILGSGNWDGTGGPYFINLDANVTYYLIADLSNGALTTTVTVSVVCPCSPNTWTGATSSDWDTPSNWSCNRVPTNTDDVVISAAAANKPIIAASTNARCQNLTVNSGAELTLDADISFGGGFTIYGDIINNGSFIDNSTVIIKLLGSDNRIGGTGDWGFFGPLLLQSGAKYTLINDVLNLYGFIINNGGELNVGIYYLEMLCLIKETGSLNMTTGTVEISGGNESYVTGYSTNPIITDAGFNEGTGKFIYSGALYSVTDPTVVSITYYDLRVYSNGGKTVQLGSGSDFSCHDLYIDNFGTNEGGVVNLNNNINISGDLALGFLDEYLYGSCYAITLNMNTKRFIGNNSGKDFYQAPNTNHQINISYTDESNFAISGFSMPYTFYGTVTYNSGTQQQVMNNTYYNLVISGTGTRNLTANTTINGNLTINNGTLTTTASNYNIDIKGDWTNNGTFTAGTGTVTFTGNNNSVIISGGTGLGKDLYNLTVNKTNVANQIQLANNDLNITNNLTMTNGNIDAKTNDKVLILGTAPGNLGTLSYTAGFVYGKMRRWFSGTNSGNSTGLFPFGVGSNNRNMLIEYTAAPTSGSLTAFFKEDGFMNWPSAWNIQQPWIAPLGICSGFFVTSLCADGYWETSASSLANGTYSITLNGDGLVAAGSVLCYLTAVKSASADNGWDFAISGNHVVPTGSDAHPVVKRSGVISGFSKWGLAGGGEPAPLPISLLSFNAVCKNDIVNINWSTASEINNDYFAIQRSTDASHWEFVKNVPGAGNSNMVLYYSITDNNPYEGTSYYRLKQTDFDGSSETFSPVVVLCGKDAGAQSISYYPNPFTSEVVVDMQNITFDRASFKIYDLLGTLVYEKEISNNELTVKKVVLDLSFLAASIYSVEFRSDGFSNTSKIVKNY